MTMRLSNSSIQTFKSCRRLYQLRYVEGVYPSTSAEVLTRGSAYHLQVEKILRGEPRDECDPKIDGMISAFQRYVLPKLGEVECVEEWFERPLGDDRILVGRCDGVKKDGTIVEHKTTSAAIDGNYVSALEHDEQVLTYLWAYQTNRMLYTVCRTPTIRQKNGETAEEFRDRCRAWYETETDQKIALLELFRTDEEIQEFGKELAAIAEEVEKTSLFYRVPSHCHKWGRMCEYAPICKNYNPDIEYVGFERRKAE